MMRRSVFLTLLIALFSMATAWAEFNPTPGVKYALQEKTSGLYLDIQTLGIYDPPVYENSGVKTNNVSLSSAPCAIYFEAFSWEGAWAMKNINEKYVCVDKNCGWNPQIGNTKQDWVFTENSAGYITIGIWGPNIVGNTKEGTPLYLNNTDAPLEFSLVDFVEQVQEYTLQINAPEGMPVTVEYDGQTIANGGTITTSSSINKNLFTATNLEGYTWEVVVDRVNHTITLEYTQVVQGGELNGYYHIYNNSNPLYIHYYAGGDTWNEAEWTYGYKLISGKEGLEASEGDKIFTITPSNGGYTLSAQGHYLGKTRLEPATWRHVLFAEEENEVGTYVFEEADGLWKIRCADSNTGLSYLSNWYGIFGNDAVGNASTFTIAPLTSYSITIPESGYLPLCLPYNVVLPQGVEAYDINNLNEAALVKGEGLLVKIAVEGNTLKAGTPVILKGTAGNYTLGLTMSSEGAIGSLKGSVLRGNYVKQILRISYDVKRFVLNGEVFEAIMGSLDLPANSCWVEANIEDDYIDLEPKFIEIAAVDEEGNALETNWKFRVMKTGKGLIITDCVEHSGGHLVIAPTYEVEGETLEIIAVEDDFLHDNLDLTKVTFPYTLTNVGDKHANYMFEITYSGPDKGKGENIGGGGNTDAAESWIGTSHDCRYKVLGTSTWRMTVDVRLSMDNLEHFNEYGSCLFATKEKTLSNNYNDGSMQLYLRADKGIVLKLDQTGDTYMFNNPANLSNLPNGTQYVGDAFTFILENDGAGGYMAQMVYGDGTVEAFEITAADYAELHDFNTIWSSLGKGIEVNVKFEKLTNKGLFVGCKNLTTIAVDEANPSFTGCDHGVLYNKSMTHIIRFPEAGGEVIEDCGYPENGHRHFETPRTVTMVYAGALHGVNAHVVFHSNPLIMHVEGHEDHMIAKYHLVLDDDSEVIDFVTANANTFETFHYRRAPLAEGKFGTIMLPFVPENNVQEKYEFFKLLRGNTESIFFRKVADGALEANVPYLFRLLEGKSSIVLGEDKDKDKTVDVFYSKVKKTIEDVGNNVFVSNADDSWETVGCYNIEKKVVGDESDAYYGVNEGNLVRVATWFRAKPYRAYYKLKNAGTTAPAKLVLRLDDGSTTEITPDQIEGWETSIYYDLMGRRVLNPTNGIYIVNGQKVVIK